MIDKNNQLFIVVAGNIGSGKTTLTKMLCERLNLKPFYESVEDNPYLSDFYADMNRWSFPLQIYFLSHRFQTHKMIEQSGASAVQDRSIYEDAHIFARALFEQGDLDKRDYESYLRLYHSMTEHLRYPTLMIFLKRSLPKLKERIQLRGRGYEQSIPSDYLERLNGYYHDWYEGYTGGKALHVDTDDLDFIEQPEHFDQLVQRIYDSMEQQDLFYTY